MSGTKLKVFVDTNVLLHINETSLNLEASLDNIISSNYEIIIHPMVEGELIESLGKGGKLAHQARFAMQLVTKYSGYQTEKESDGADLALMLAARETSGCVLTFDTELRDRCIKSKIPVISPYRKGKLRVYGHLE